MKRLLPLILAAWLAGIGGAWAQQVFYLSGLQPAHGGGALSGTDTTFWCDKNTGSPPGCGAADPLKQVTLQQIENFVFSGLSGIPPIAYGSPMGAFSLNYDSTLSVIGGQLHVVGGGGGGPTIPNAALLSGNGTSIGGVTLGTNLNITGSFPNQTLNATGGGGGGGTVGSGVGPQIAQYPSGTGTAVAGVTVSGDANLAIGGVLTINPLAVTAGKMASGAAASNVGTLGGDLAGSTLPNPTIANNAVTSAKIGTGQVTYANIQNVTAGRLLGNPTGGAAAPSEISLGSGLSFTGNVLNAALPIPAAGSANAIQYNSGGTLGGFGPVANAVAITSAAGVPSESTTLPAGLTIPTATVTSPAINGGTIVSLPNPTNPQDAATKAYVDAAASSGISHPAVQAATTAALSGTWTYANGTAGVGATLTAPAGTTTLTLDGYVVVNGDRVLIKDQGATNGFQNGPYTAAISGSPVVLTRVTDMNQAAAGSMALGGYMTVNNGPINSAPSQWGLGAPTPASITMGTTILTFNKLSSSTAYTADGTSLKLTGNVFSANLIPPGAGGTGVANTNTITLGGNLVTGGAFATSGGFGLTLTLTGATNVTLPVSGTLLANARLINTTAPLTGGGDLTADRTLALSGPSNLTTFASNTIPKGAGTSPFAASSLTDNGTAVSTAENFSAAAGTFSGNITTNITGSTECVHANIAGVLSGVGSGLDCGSGTVNVGAALQAAYYATGAAAVSGNPNVTYQSGFTRFNYMTTPGAVPAPLSGTEMQLAGSDTNPTRFESDAFGAAAKFDGVCYGGTSSSLAAVGSGVICGGYQVFAYNGTAVSAGALGGIRMVTTQPQTTTNGGMQTAVQSTPNNSTSIQDTLIAGQDGSLTVLNQAGTGTRCVHADPTGKQSTTATDCSGTDSVSAGLTATGTVQGTCNGTGTAALGLTSQQNYIGTVAAGTGVCLPTPGAGTHAVVCDEDVNDLNVYAPSGGAVINKLSSITAYIVTANSCALFASKNSSSWRSVQ